MAYTQQNESGLLGWSNQRRRFLASTEGVLGFAPKKATNLRLQVLAPPGGGAIADITLRLTYTEAGNQVEELIPFRAEFNPYERTLPTGTPVTIEVLNPSQQYLALSRTTTLQPSVPQTLLLQLYFRSAYAYHFRRKYL
ncbi:hypothetical protein [Hymenobacter glacieicola]|uniref:Uncharacterized protein n=1 Tax=Hymenobacter glacieicola TaxID=1562124 RepID=A0ABQ1WLS1_9BACT|nr:hypothetical protein [Hymenobacter glacieicola]GGG33497.1 hypothetical protein GCM10011378_07460 [Hymenobacter glacieicola]